MTFKQRVLLPVMAFACLTYTAAASAEAEQYIVDVKGAHASIEFRTLHLGYSWLVGRFNEFSGQFTFDDENPENNTITIDINVDSIDSNHAERDKHLRSDDYLDTEKFPDAKFASTKIIPSAAGGYEVTGDFTLHGVTKSISFNAKQVGSGDDPWGGYRRGFEAETEIAFADYGYEFNLGPATKTAIIRLYLEGIKQ